MKKNLSILLTTLVATALMAGCTSPATDGQSNPVADAKTADQMNTPKDAPTTDSAKSDATKDDSSHMGSMDNSGVMMDNGAKSGESSPADAPMVDKDGNKVVAFTNKEGKLVCPVMGSVIPDAKDAVGYQDYKGKRYYFCCDGCPQSFKADPAKYADGKFLAEKDKK